MNCSNCGTTLQPGDKFCTSCGTKVEEQQEKDNNQERTTSSVAPPPPPPPALDAHNQPSSPPSPSSPQNSYAQTSGNPPVVGIFKFMLIQILLIIPIVNLVVIFVLSFRGGINPNLKNYGRAMLIFMVLGIALMFFTGGFEILFNLFRGGNMWN